MNDLATLPDVGTVSMAELEREIVDGAGNLAAAECRWLLHVALFDAAGGWRGLDIRSCAHWLMWRCGLSTSAATERVRVARALIRLPLVRAAFGEGRLSYSKVRALSRVATVDDEDTLVSIATSCNAAQLDRLVAGLRRARSDEHVVHQIAAATFTARWQPDGSLRFTGHLSAEHGAVLLAALAAVQVERPADELVDAAGDPARCQSEERAATHAARDDAYALVELARHTLSAPAPSVGTNPVRLLIHTTDRALADGSATSADIGEGPSADPSAEVWTTTETQQPQPFPVEAARPSRTGAATDPTDPTDGGNSTVGILDAGPGIPALPLGPQTLRRLLCDSLVETTSGDTHRRFADRRQRRALLARDHGCAFPACPRRRALHAHHVQHWINGGATALRNLALLCEAHHLAIHEGHWQLHRTERGWTVIRPDGRTLEQAPSTAGDPDALLQNLTLTRPAAVGGDWDGTPLQLGYVVDIVETHRAHNRRRREAAEAAEPAQTAAA